MKGLNWTWVIWGSEQQEELRCQITYHTYPASGGLLSYTPSVEHVIAWLNNTLFHSDNFGHLLIT